eukprot:Pgem_evm1s12330
MENIQHQEVQDPARDNPMSKWKNLLLTDKQKLSETNYNSWIIRMEANISKNNMKDCLIVPNDNENDPRGQLDKD